MKLAWATAKKLVKMLYPNFFDVWGTIGFYDPAKTGWFIGMYEAVAAFFGIRDNVRIAGDFCAESFTVKLNAEVRGRINIFRMAVPVIRLLIRKPVRNFIRGYFK